MKKTLNFALAGLAMLAVVAAFTAMSQAHADDSSSSSQGDGASAQVQNHGAVVSQVAQMNEEAEQSQNQQMQQTQPSVSIDPSGHFTVTGVTVNSVDTGANTLTVSLYGFTRTINVSGAAITGAGQTNLSLSNIQAGDVLSGTGTFDPTSHEITVSTIVDTSYTVRNRANIQAQINQLLQLLQQLQAQVQSQNQTQTQSQIQVQTQSQGN